MTLVMGLLMYLVTTQNLASLSPRAFYCESKHNASMLQVASFAMCGVAPPN
jgi:hypothetical protein